MSQVTVALTTTTILAADPDQERRVSLQNLDAANPVYLEVGAAATVAAGLRLAAATTLPTMVVLQPGNALNGIATTATVDVRYLVY